MLIGFLFALAIIVPVYLAYFLVGLEAERFKAFASFPLLAFFYLFGQFAIYRARRYRLTRTVWRGVRFWMSGSGWAYAARAALWGLLVDRSPSACCCRGAKRRSSATRCGIPITAICRAVLKAAAGSSSSAAGGCGCWRRSALYIFPLAPFVYGAFKAVEWRWWLSGIRFGGVRLESNLRRGALIGLYWKVIGWFLLLVLAFVGLSGIARRYWSRA